MPRLIPVLAGLLMAMAAMPGPGRTNGGGAPSGRAGSPAENGLTCATSGCHSSFALNSGPGAVHIQAGPVYSPGTPLEFTVRVEQEGAARFGFQITAVDGAGSLVGTFDPTADATTKAADFAGHYLTHMLAPFVADAAVWMVRWLPPSEAGLGPVTFHAAGNAANGNRATSGDHIYTTSLEVEEASGTGVVRPVSAHAPAVFVWPNPASTTVRLSAPAPTPFDLYDLLGRRVADGMSGAVGADVSMLAPGVYLVVLKSSRAALPVVVRR